MTFFNYSFFILKKCETIANGCILFFTFFKLKSRSTGKLEDRGKKPYNFDRNRKRSALSEKEQPKTTGKNHENIEKIPKKN